MRDSEWADSFTWLWEENNWLYNCVTWFRIIINKWSAYVCVCGCVLRQKCRETVQWVVKARLRYRSVLIPHSLSCWLSGRQHIVYQLHTHGTGRKEWHEDRETKKLQYNKNRVWRTIKVERRASQLLFTWWVHLKSAQFHWLTHNQAIAWNIDAVDKQNYFSIFNSTNNNIKEEGKECLVNKPWAEWRWGINTLQW